MALSLSDGAVRVRAQRRAIAGVLIAIAVTSTMDATGLSAFSALPLLPLMLLFRFLDRIPWRTMGFVLGRWRHYGLAVLYPVLVLGLIAAVAGTSGVVDFSKTDWGKAWLNCALIGASTILVAIVTEEGFFRGWLWASLERGGRNRMVVLVWTSIAFSLWHLSAVTLETGFDLPRAQIPVFMVNAALMGAAWGLMRAISRSVLVASVSHGVWNGMTYSLFGFGTTTGALGIKETAIYGPEVGYLGFGLNVLFISGLWWLTRARSIDLMGMRPGSAGVRRSSVDGVAAREVAE